MQRCIDHNYQERIRYQKGRDYQPGSTLETEKLQKTKSFPGLPIKKELKGRFQVLEKTRFYQGTAACAGTIDVRFYSKNENKGKNR